MKHDHVLALSPLLILLSLAVMSLVVDVLRVSPGGERAAVAADIELPGGEPGATAGLDQAHDVAISGCINGGLAPVNLSDTAGSVMYIACDITNLGDHDDMVVITSGSDLIVEALPEGCTASGSLTIPGRVDFVLLAAEEKRVLYRTGFECHSPAVPSTMPFTIHVAVAHVAQADGLEDANPSNNSVTLHDTLVIAPATDPPGPTDSDGDGYTNAAEALIGTGDSVPCGGGGWPSDLATSSQSYNRLDMQDLASFVTPVRRLNTLPGDLNFDARWDLVPGTNDDTQINLEDLAALIAGLSGYPPMLGYQKALGRSCPWPE